MNITLSLFGYYWILVTLLRKRAHHVLSSMEDLVAKKNTYSPVWAFFGLKKDHEDDDNCTLSSMPSRRIGARRNTRNLFSHLKIYHAKEHASIEKSKKKKASAANKDNSHNSGKQITLYEAIERMKPYTHGSQRWKDITASVTHFMAKEMIPIHTVEKPGFHSMVRKLDPQYEISVII